MVSKEQAFRILAAAKGLPTTKQDQFVALVEARLRPIMVPADATVDRIVKDVRRELLVGAR